MKEGFKDVFKENSNKKFEQKVWTKSLNKKFEQKVWTKKFEQKSLNKKISNISFKL
jgi:hypothetical protein